ncbi:MAG: T9SS type A sorting domain-containing protein [Saprospiraceae bacterium]|nr:T9SS type A sorting domain-containing protein [Saprospiraceae bacterium]
MDIVWDGEKLITTGQFLTATAPDNALNGLLYMELDTNGNTLFTDIYFHPNDALAPQVGNSIYRSSHGLTYTTGQILYSTSSYLSIYGEQERIATVEIPFDGLQSWIFHCIDWHENILLTGQIQNHQYRNEGMLINASPTGHEIWRKYYGSPGLDCGIGEPYIADANTIILPGFKQYWPNIGPIANNWLKTWIVAVDSLGHKKWEWESPVNIESGVNTRLLKLSNGNWLYTTFEFIPMPGQIDDFAKSPKIVCRDSNFNLVWERYIASHPTSANYVIDLSETSDGNYILAGRISTDEWGGGCILHKFTPSGDSIWTYLDHCDPFFGCQHFLGGIAELPGGSIVAAGLYENLVEDKSHGLLIKVDKNGCIDTLCGNFIIGTREAEIVSKIKVFPNPTSDFIKIGYPIGDRIEVVDLNGKVVQSMHTNQSTEQEINIQHLPKGVYIVRMQEKALRVSYKIIKY